MQKRFFIVESDENNYKLRELSPALGQSIQQYGSVTTCEVECQNHDRVLLFVQSNMPQEQIDRVASDLCECGVTDYPITHDTSQSL